jgi:hypothetical protein
MLIKSESCGSLDQLTTRQVDAGLFI